MLQVYEKEGNLWGNMIKLWYSISSLEELNANEGE